MLGIHSEKNVEIMFGSMMYDEDKMLEEKAKSFEEGKKHSNMSGETRSFVLAMEERIRGMILDHEKREFIENAKAMEEFGGMVKETKQLIEDHIKLSKESDDTIKFIKDFISGGLFVKRAFIFVVGIMAGMGVVVGTILAIKEWVKK